MATLSLEEVRARLTGRAFDVAVLPDGEKRAAVGAILRPGSAGPEILLIKRADKDGDPWSGQMAFPGGRQDPRDVDLAETVRRETFEEVGLDLAREAELVARLDDIHAVARGRRMGLVIAPFVFVTRGQSPLVARSEEVAEALWTPIEPLWRGEVATTFTYVHEGQPLEFPGFRVGHHVVWGLTYRMLTLLFEALAEPVGKP